MKNHEKYTWPGLLFGVVVLAFGPLVPASILLAIIAWDLDWLNPANWHFMLRLVAVIWALFIFAVARVWWFRDAD